MVGDDLVAIVVGGCLSEDELRVAVTVDAATYPQGCRVDVEGAGNRVTRRVHIQRVGGGLIQVAERGDPRLIGGRCIGGSGGHIFAVEDAAVVDLYEDASRRSPGRRRRGRRPRHQCCATIRTPVPPPRQHPVS